MSAQDAILGAILQEDEVLPLPVMVALHEFIEEYVPDHPVAIKKVLEAYNNLLEYIPPGHLISHDELQRGANAGYKQPTMSVPFYDILTKPGEAILHFVGPFFHKETKEAGLFEAMRRQLLDNENAASGMTNVDRVLGRKDVVGVDEYKAEPPELIRLYLRHTPFYDLFHTQIEFRIPTKTWSSHGVALAPSGHGKTQLVQSIMVDLLKDPHQGFFFVDPHGDAANILAERVEPSRLVVLDPETNPPPLNFLDFGNSTEAQTLQTFSYLMSSLSGGMSDKQGAIVPYLLKLLRRIPKASVETLRLIVDEKVKRPEQSQFAAYIADLPSVDQGFFNNQFYHSSMEPTKQAIGWKIYSAMSSDVFKEMFAASHSAVDFNQLIAERKVVVIKGGFDVLGEDGMRVFLQFMVGQYYAAGMRRLKIHEKDRHLCIMFVDEASHVFTSPIIARLLFDLRKVNCAFFGATQVWDQIATEVKSAVLGNTAIKMAGALQHNDAMVLSREMYCDHDFIRNTQRVDDKPYSHWAMYVSGMTKQAARVRVPFFALEKMPVINPDREGMSFDDCGEEEDIKGLFARYSGAKARGRPTETHEAPEGASHSVMPPKDSQSRDDVQQRNGTRAPDSLIKPGKDWD